MFSCYKLKFLSLFHALLGAALATNGASAWSDEGHMLVAAVAKVLLPPSLVEHIEATLAEWNDDYPGTGEMQTAAVWLDHLSCRDSTPYCSGFRAQDDVQVFKTWHYSNYVFNPQNVELAGIYKYYPLPKTGAEWALKTVYNSLKETGAPAVSESPRDARKPTGPTLRGSPFSLNLHLRLLLHIFGDIHQPLHACSLFTKDFPNGDGGGNDIILRGVSRVDNLHALWDSGGGVFRRPFFAHKWEELEAIAKQLIEEYPKEKFGDRLTGHLFGTDFSAIAKESAAIGETIAYSEFDWSTFSKDSLPYEPSKEYIQKVRAISREQIALGGYRLANLFNSIPNGIPPPSQHILSSSANEEQEQLQEEQQQQKKTMFLLFKDMVSSAFTSLNPQKLAGFGGDDKGQENDPTDTAEGQQSSSGILNNAKGWIRGLL